MLSFAQIEGEAVQARHYMEENHRRPRVAVDTDLLNYHPK
jgi:hypothetical protein